MNLQLLIDFFNLQILKSVWGFRWVWAFRIHNILQFCTISICACKNKQETFYQLTLVDFVYPVCINVFEKVKQKQTIVIQRSIA